MVNPSDNKRGISDKDLRRFLSKFDQLGPDECWEWKGKLQVGYGHFTLDFWPYVAHRISYELAIGPIPERTHLHHRCENRACVNPNHLELITPEEHGKKHHADKTHCKRGHELSPENTYVNKRTGVRACRRCLAWRKNEAARIANPDGPIAPYSDLYCKHGHPLFGDNMVLIKNWYGGYGRRCKKCSNEVTKKYNRANKSKVAASKLEKRERERMSRENARANAIRQLDIPSLSNMELLDKIDEITRSFKELCKT